MNKELLQQALIERCYKDAADRDCPYFARDTLTKAADMLAAIAQPVPPATVQGEPLPAMIDMSKHVEQMPDGSYRPIYKTDLTAATSAKPANEWHEAVLNSCMMIESCYVEANPVQTVKSLIDWHVLNERDLVNDMTNATPSRYALKDLIVNDKPEGDDKDAAWRASAERLAILKAIGDAGLILIKTHQGFDLVKLSAAIAKKKATQ